MVLHCQAKTLWPYLKLASTLRYGIGLRSPCQHLTLRTSQRNYSTTSPDGVKSDGASSTTVAPSAAPTGDQLSSAQRFGVGMRDHKVNRFEKYLLVWGGKFKSVDDVPNLVSQDSLERARNKARIKINLMMMALTVVGCIAMIIAGKKAAAEGQSITTINRDWHKKMNEQSGSK